MYHWIDAFDKPAFGTAGSEARTIRKRCFVKYSLILLSALLVVACGGLTKEQQLDAYNEVVGEFNSSVKRAETVYETAIDSATTDEEGTQALSVLYSDYAAAEFLFANKLEAIAWTSDVQGPSSDLITCSREVYLLQLEVISVTNFEEANELADAADAKSATCDAKVAALIDALDAELVPN